jgi:hypothetical protein
VSKIKSHKSYSASGSLSWSSDRKSLELKNFEWFLFRKQFLDGGTGPECQLEKCRIGVIKREFQCMGC